MVSVTSSAPDKAITQSLRRSTGAITSREAADQCLPVIVREYLVHLTLMQHAERVSTIVGFLEYCIIFPCQPWLCCSVVRRKSDNNLRSRVLLSRPIKSDRLSQVDQWIRCDESGRHGRPYGACGEAARGRIMRKKQLETDICMASDQSD
jgi:hypothetical protein